MGGQGDRMLAVNSHPVESDLTPSHHTRVFSPKVFVLASYNVNSVKGGNGSVRDKNSAVC